MNATYITLFIATVSVGMVYGTDSFFALIGRPALAQSRTASLVDVMGHFHAVADTRMPLIGALGLFSTIAFVVLNGRTQPQGWLGLAALAGLLAHVACYRLGAYAINQRFIAAAREEQVLDDARQQQQRWDLIVSVRAVLLLLSLSCLVVAGYFI